MLKSKRIIVCLTILSFLLVGCSNNKTAENNNVNTNTSSNTNSNSASFSGNSRTGQEVILTTGGSGDNRGEVSYEMIFGGRKRR